MKAQAAPLLTVQDAMLSKAFRIMRTRRETHDTFTVELEPAEGDGGYAYAPGQFNMVYVFGVGEIPISISGDPTKSLPLVHTTRAVGTVTKAMQNLKRGDLLGVRGPYGTSWPVEAARGADVVIVAGGIGLAPLRPAIYQILSQRDKYGRIVLLYGARTPVDLLYPKELEHWRGRFDMEVYVTVDRSTRKWRGNVGVVTTLIHKAPFDPFSSVAFVCGPEVMMRYSVQELERRGVAEDRIHVSMERNMKCGCGLCGHCQAGAVFVCKDGPVFPYSRVKDIFSKREV